MRRIAGMNADFDKRPRRQDVQRRSKRRLRNSAGVRYAKVAVRMSNS